jgi:hypothetical protein
MVALLELWLPILVAAVFVFLVSSVLHMVLPLHKRDFAKLADEDAVLAALRQHGVAPGEYVFPHCGSMRELSSPEMRAKLAQGPAGWLTVLPPGGLSMGKSLAQRFAFSIVVSIFAAYLASLTVPPAGAFGEVFRTTSTVAMLGYGVTNVTSSIWKGARRSVTFVYILDGILYGVATGLAFAWGWPTSA